MGSSQTVFLHWRISLLQILTWFENFRNSTRNPYLKAFAVFVVLNLSCYWWALLTTYPERAFGDKAEEYLLMGFPVALFGAVFDNLSLFCNTIYYKTSSFFKNKFILCFLPEHRFIYSYCRQSLGSICVHDIGLGSQLHSGKSRNYRVPSLAL